MICFCLGFLGSASPAQGKGANNPLKGFEVLVKVVELRRLIQQAVEPFCRHKTVSHDVKQQAPGIGKFHFAPEARVAVDVGRKRSQMLDRDAL